ncbi:hypothetical protein KBB96_02795 [Luteolibacter ambystomatis]|uniref:Uncharacterized protein n=1 Tax=Luteolibacter ambystomatis TaxID=2824561 RepID=A0A975J0L6_9BACT|nr:hypothetical protein [Luteolibacter ambystomatis]QUE51825.1 hypothetical protein KBB96_02795 [Luteolibacter ambystomatis]
MKPSLVPGICGLALTAMIAVGGHHWWEVRQQVAAWQAAHGVPAPLPSDLPNLTSPELYQRMRQEMDALRKENKDLQAEMQGTTRKLAAAQGAPPAAPTPSPPREAAKPAPATAANTPNTNSATAKEFFQGMLDELKALKQENKDLRDQVAETNRDLMEVQFRLDSHSASFRPLKIKNDDSQGDATSYDPILDRPRDPESGSSGVLPPRAIVPGLELPQ